MTEIQNLISSYTLAVNKRQWEEVEKLFIETATWQLVGYMDLKANGRKEIMDFITQSVGGCAYLCQLNFPALIRVEGDTAHAESMMREVANLPQVPERAEVDGIYEDVIVRTDDGWKFKSRVFTVLERRSLPL